MKCVRIDIYKYLKCLVNVFDLMIWEILDCVYLDVLLFNLKWIWIYLNKWNYDMYLICLIEYD